MGHTGSAPSGYDDALYRVLGLVIRQLHVRKIISAPDLIREMHQLADQLDASKEADPGCLDGIRGMAASFEREQPLWDEAQIVHGLYQDRSGR